MAVKKKSTIKGGEVGSVKALRKSLKRGTGTTFLKNVPDEGINVRFLTEPDKWVEYYEHYDEDRTDSRYFPCSEDCEGCEKNLRKSKRYLTNALDLDDGQKVIPLKLPASLAGMLLKRFDKFDTMMDRDYELSKEGSGLDTEYSEAYESPKKRNLSKFELLDLWSILEGQLNGSDEDDEEEDDDDTPVRKVTKGGSAKGVKKKPVVDDDEDDDDEDEDDEPVVKKRVVKKKPGSKPVKKSIKKKK